MFISVIRASVIEINMQQATLKKWGNSTGFIIPAQLLATLGLSAGDEVEVGAENGTLILKQKHQPLTLSELLAKSPPGSLVPTDEDKEWLNMSPVGRESL